MKELYKPFKSQAKNKKYSVYVNQSLALAIYLTDLGWGCGCVYEQQFGRPVYQAAFMFVD